MQLSIIETSSEKETRERVEELVQLEDRIQEAHQEMNEIRQTQRRNRTVAQRRQLQQLPDSLAMMESEIENIIDELGSEYFRNFPGGSDAEIKSLIKLKISKSKLYEAKVGVLEMQKRWDQRGSGTRVQATYKKQMNTKMSLLKKKWTSYNNRATAFNTEFSPQVEVGTPAFEEVKALGIDNLFWNVGRLDHPSEPWAVDPSTQEGIQAYLIVSHCQDELHRIAREARQAVKWAIDKSQKIEQLHELLQTVNHDTDVPTEQQQHLRNIYNEFNCSKGVVQSVFGNMVKKHSRLWLSWDSHCIKLLSWSDKYINSNEPAEVCLRDEWETIITSSRQRWERLVFSKSIMMQFDNQDDQVEEEFLEQEGNHQINNDGAEDT
ncbi:hypothetical protein MJO28_012734 [Puccinia striiformis f. sp. tritici]|uniref:Uncharacterized protein n=1 Tax=Puccinia striiformis f. sp. tritici TaxID=168172 RepID=A0ACC0E124_9BASI|nr:hypothetical protein MJO28_012734 [Puccinia striiformis f. sp. tritici]